MTENILSKRFTMHFPAFWLWLGFSGGAALLLLIVLPLESWLSKGRLDRTTVNVVLSSIILAWVVVSGFFSWIAARKTQNPWPIHLAGLILFCLVFGTFLQAGSGLFARFRTVHEESVGSHFVFGPYPNAAAMLRLKQDGFTGVVTLLSPMVPFEAVLLKQERAAADAAGMRLVEASMLPWISGNQESLSIITKLASSREGKYYVHCYLGRHRADLARFTIMDVTGGAATEVVQRLTGSRTAKRHRLARGRLYYIGDTLILGPRPTKDEWFEFVIPAGVRRVVTLNAADSEERMLAAASGIEIRNLSDAPVDPRVNSRTYVHSNLTDDKIFNLLNTLDPDATLRSRPERAFDYPVGWETRDTASTVSFGVEPSPDDARQRSVRLVSLFDPGDPQSHGLLKRTEKLRAAGFMVMDAPVRLNQDARLAMGAIRHAGGAVYIFGQTVPLARVKKLFQYKALPERLASGKIERVDSKVFVGPHPTDDEWSSVLIPAGVTSYICLLDPALPGNRRRIEQAKDSADDAGVRFVLCPPEKMKGIKKTVEDERSKGLVYVASFRRMISL